MADEAPGSPVRTYDGGERAVQWHRGLCIHMGECNRAGGGLFEAGRDPWCDPSLVEEGDALAVVARCPSGALSITRADGTSVEAPPARNTITVSSRGPLYARGDLQLEGRPDDAPGTQFRAALCRCGQSANKPFCDNSHEQSGFSDHGAVDALREIAEDADAAIEAGGSLTITPRPNGPYLVNGPMTVVTGSGIEAWRGTKAAFCRCGQSSNKPFCDGTHTKVGFTTD